MERRLGYLTRKVNAEPLPMTDEPGGGIGFPVRCVVFFSGFVWHVRTALSWR